MLQLFCSRTVEAILFSLNHRDRASSMARAVGPAEHRLQVYLHRRAVDDVGCGQSAIDGVTVDTARLDALAARTDAEKLRLGLVDLRAQHVRWQLPEGTKFADALASVWSPTLHNAAHVILKRIGKVRAQLVALGEQSNTDGHKHKKYVAAMRGVYFESYLDLPPRLATALFRTRSDS